MPEFPVAELPAGRSGRTLRALGRTGGTSLAVYPAAGLIRYFRGDDLVVINKQPTPADGMATLLVNKPIGQALSETEGEGGAICR